MFSSQLEAVHPETIAELNDLLLAVLNKAAPVCERDVPDRPPAPWLTEQVKVAKRSKRQAERRWRKSSLQVHKDIYKKEQNKMCEIVRDEKKRYVCEKIESGSSKDMFRLCNDLLGKSNEKMLPTNISPERVPDSMNSFFVSKIEMIREELDANCLMPENRDFNGEKLSDFEPVTEDFVKKLILDSPKTSCELDPLPISLFVECLDVLLPHITKIINDSLENGIVPTCFKEAVVRPLLKKKNLDNNVLNNYRPVSNLSFLSKILEKVVLKQLDEHLIKYDLKDIYQSAYRSKHSCETALLKVNSDLLIATDSGKVSILALLDLSAAFDTLDHDILFQRLQCSFGITGTVLQWFKSYLSDRVQTVKTGMYQSEPTSLRFGVPQGSVLGPILFSLYSQPLVDVLMNHGFNYHMYADDTQLYGSAELTEVSALVKSLQTCMADVSSWMKANKLKLNPEKTEIMMMGTPFKVKSVAMPVIELNCQKIEVSHVVKNLGVFFNSSITSEDHISYLRKICYLELRRISQIRQYLTEEATTKLVCTFILPRLDYCNSLLAASPDIILKKLQQIQNNAARLVKKCSKRDHITPILKDLHWLPIKHRIEYKIATLSFQCLNDASFPLYLKNLVSPHIPSRNLRSSNSKTLRKPKTHLKSYGERALPYQSAEVWNHLPPRVQNSISLESFKSNVKTHLFLK